MATIREGDQSVLLVVDVQVGVMDGAWEAPRIVANVARVVASARAREVPVVWVQHENEELAVGTPAWRWVPELVPASHEPLVRKRYNSAFEDTTLEAKLAGLGATRIVLAGADSNWCIRATAHGALDRGYDLTLVRDAHTTSPIELDDGRVIAAQDIVTELNVAMTWLRYPGRANRTVAAAEVGFGRPCG